RGVAWPAAGAVTANGAESPDGARTPDMFVNCDEAASSESWARHSAHRSMWLSTERTSSGLRAPAMNAAAVSASTQWPAPCASKPVTTEGYRVLRTRETRASLQVASVAALDEVTRRLVDDGRATRALRRGAARRSGRACGERLRELRRVVVAPARSRV